MLTKALQTTDKSDLQMHHLQERRALKQRPVMHSHSPFQIGLHGKQILATDNLELVFWKAVNMHKTELFDWILDEWGQITKHAIRTQNDPK